MSIANRIALMRAGHLVQLGSPLDLYNRPVNLWSSQFIGTHPINVFPCRLDAAARTALLCDEAKVTLSVPPAFLDRVWAQTESPNVILGVRPEFVVIEQAAGSADGVAAEIYTKEVLGSSTLYDLTVGPHHVRSVQPSTRQFYAGEDLRLSFLWEGVFVFESDATGANKCLVNITEGEVY